MATETKAKWWETHTELVAFARVLVDSQGTLEAADVIRYLEKPWKWGPEYERWVALGRPDVVTVGMLDEPEADDEDEELSLTPAGRAAQSARAS